MLILASSSIYRKELLSRIIEEYQIEIPDIDESKYDHEDAKTSAIRLALEKAEKIALTLPDSFIIGADQTAESNHIQINKPNNYEEAFEQLKKLSGKDVSFYSAICLICKSKKIKYEYVSEVNVKYKNLSENEIESYLKYEKPYGCLGCIKSEGLGISLLEKVSSEDPTAIIGLPLIALSQMLKDSGIKLKSEQR